MSLRLRLTLLYTTVLGGALLIFGALVYAVVTVTLQSQVDTNLTQVAQELIPRLRLNSANQFDTRGLGDFRISENIAIQLWGNNQQIQYSRDAAKNPLNENGLLSGRVIFETINQPGRAPLRVLTVPLSGARGPAGVLQIGLSLRLADTAVSILATTLVFFSILAVLFTMLTIWITTRRALAPLETMTRVATQITRADDLQRRIPLTGDEKDEVGQVVLAFNSTMERLEKLFNTQRRFLADVSHELRTPLTVIKGNAGLIRKLGTIDEESLNGIETEVDRLARLVGDLLLLAQAESGKVPMIMKPVELDTLLLEVFQQMRLLAGERLQVKIVEIDQLLVVADRDRLKQVLVNLVANAIQYTPAGGTVSLSLRNEQNQALLEVRDTGPGIPAEDLPHIFERFYRGEKSRKRSQNTGFGLGLSIAYWIVENHNGRLEAHSKEGEGTTFVLRLPLLVSQNTL